MVSHFSLFSYKQASRAPPNPGVTAPTNEILSRMRTFSLGLFQFQTYLKCMADHLLYQIFLLMSMPQFWGRFEKAWRTLGVNGPMSFAVLMTLNCSCHTLGRFWCHSQCWQSHFCFLCGIRVFRAMAIAVQKKKSLYLNGQLYSVLKTQLQCRFSSSACCLWSLFICVGSCFKLRLHLQCLRHWLHLQF